LLHETKRREQPQKTATARFDFGTCSLKINSR